MWPLNAIPFKKIYLLNTINMKSFLPLLFTLCSITAVMAQDSQKLVLLANWDVDTLPAAGSNSYNDCWGYTDCNGNEYAILGSAAYSHFFDITDPTNPIELASFWGGNTTTWRDFKTYRDRAYGVCDNCTEGLQIFDLSNIQDTVIRTYQETEFWGESHNIFIDEQHGRLYSAGTDDVNNGLVILDLTGDPDAPTLLANIHLPGGYVHDVYVRDHIAYCSHGFNGLYIYDMSDPTNPITLGTITEYPESGYNHSSWLSEDGTTMIMADETFNRGLKHIDVSDFEDPQVLDVFRSKLEAPTDTASIAHNPFIRGDLVFISYYHDGIQVWDISQGEDVSRVAYLDTEPNNTNYAGFTGNWGVYPFLPSGNLVVSDMKHGLFVVGTDSLEMAPVSPTLFPDASIEVDGLNTICEGDSVNVFLPEGAQNYTWYQDGVELATNANNIYVSSQSTIYAVANNQHCQLASDSVTIEVQEKPNAVISADFTEACIGETIALKAVEGYDSYQWNQIDFPLPGEINPVLEVTESGLYSVKIADGVCSVISEEIEVEFFEPVIPTISFDGTDLLSSAATSYQWYLNGDLIEGATNTTFTPTESGNYTVETIDDNGCVGTSEALQVTINSLSKVLEQAFQVWPNPVSELITIKGLPVQSRWTYQLIAVDGKVLQEGTYIDGEPINIGSLSTGMYYIQLHSDLGFGVQSFIKE